jgi:hypothetical protein
MGVGLALAGAAIGAAGSIGGSALSAGAAKKATKDTIKSQERIAEAQSADNQRLSEMARGDAEIAQRNLFNAEQARLDVLSSLGAPGTYGPGATGPVQMSGPISFQPYAGQGTANLGDPTGSTRTGMVSGADVAIGGKARYQGSKAWEVSGPLLSSSDIAGSIKSSSGFRAMSAMVAESEQLMNRSGPLWNQLTNSVIGSAYSATAGYQRSMMEQISQMSARGGGTARNAALEFARKAQAQERVNVSHANQLMQGMFQLEQYRQTYTVNAQQAALSWVNNQAGIRDAFTASLNNLQTFWAGTMPSALIQSGTQMSGMMMNAQADAGAAMAGAAQTKIAGVTNALSGFSNVLTGIGMKMIGNTAPAVNTTAGATSYAPSASASGGFGFVVPGQ